MQNDPNGQCHKGNMRRRNKARAFIGHSSAVLLTRTCAFCAGLVTGVGVLLPLVWCEQDCLCTERCDERWNDDEISSKPEEWPRVRMDGERRMHRKRRIEAR